MMDGKKSNVTQKPVYTVDTSNIVKVKVKSKV